LPRSTLRGRSKKSMPKISVIIAQFNSANHIGKVITNIETILSETEFKYEIIVIDDGSTDHSVTVCEELLLIHPAMKLLKLSRNVGQQVSFSAGIAYCDGDYVVLLDDDTEITKAIFHSIVHPVIINQCDVSIGTTKPKGIIRRVSSAIFWRVIKRITHGAISTRELTLRCFSREVANSFVKYNEANRSLTEIMFNLGYRRKYIELHNVRFAKIKSRHSFHARLKLFLQITIAMRQNSGLGLIYFSFIAMGTFAPAVYILHLAEIIDFANRAYLILAGMIWLTWVITMFLTGLLMFSLSMVHRESRNRPLYHVRD
jgi:glycosyltransferase involved in cell wall biosynthesis